MAVDENDPDLKVIDASHLFAAHTTWIGFRRGTLLRKYMYEFAQLLAPHLDRRLIERAHRAASRRGGAADVRGNRAAGALGGEEALAPQRHLRAPPG